MGCAPPAFSNLFAVGLVNVKRPVAQVGMVLRENSDRRSKPSRFSPAPAATFHRGRSRALRPCEDGFRFPATNPSGQAVTHSAAAR